MPRIPKWLLMKEWLNYQDVMKVNESAPSQLENVFSRDESDELTHNYKFVCTFSPHECQSCYREYRKETQARLDMRTHIKGHVQSLKSKYSSDDCDFETRNQLYQKGKGQKQKVAADNHASGKIVKTSAKSRPTPYEKPQTKKKRYTKLKKVVSTENENLKPSDDSDGAVTSSPKYESMPASPVSDIREEITDSASSGNVSDEEMLDIKMDHIEHKKSSIAPKISQVAKEIETLQYKIATKLFAVDRSQWNNIDQVLDDMILAESAPDQTLEEEERAKILEGMDRWIESVKYYDQQTVTKLQEPLTKAEENILDTLSLDDWQKLDVATDPESKLRLTVYARLLLRDYEWYPRKLKPKVCRHCQKQYTASTSLYSHLVSLSGIRFWACLRCKDGDKEEATFTRKHSLQYHILKEVGIPRYRCSEPGCDKTHNHTHHQKSHARQHSGEKDIICEVENCSDDFSNRNTYGRHLLGRHSIMLTSDNRLVPIEPALALFKIRIARVRARERSKSKRHVGDGEIKTTSRKTPYEKRTSPGRVLGNKQPSIDANDEQFLGPSAAQILCGIARDVRNTTFSAGKNESNLGGLNLLATVSKYMNTEDCSDDRSNSSDSFTRGHRAKSPCYTKLIEALDVNVGSQGQVNMPVSTATSSTIPIISSLGPNKPVASTISKPIVFKESATVIPKSTVLLPLPAGRIDANANNVSVTKLPNVIFDLKQRLLNAPTYGIPQTQPQPALPTPASPTVHATNSNTDGLKCATVVTIGNKMPPMSVLSSQQGHVSTLNTKINPMPIANAVGNNLAMGTIVSPVGVPVDNKAKGFRTLTGLPGKTYIVLSTSPNTQITQSPPINLKNVSPIPGENKNVPFSEL